METLEFLVSKGLRLNDDMRISEYGGSLLWIAKQRVEWENGMKINLKESEKMVVYLESTIGLKVIVPKIQPKQTDK